MSGFGDLGPLLLIAAVVIYLWACALVGSLAYAKGHDRIEYIFIALAMSPIVGLLAVIASTTDERVLDLRAIKAGHAKRCRACREVASKKATVCRHCGGTDFEPDEGSRRA